MRVRIECARVSRYHHTSGTERGGKNPLPTHGYLCCCKSIRKRCRGNALAADARRSEGRATPRPLGSCRSWARTKGSMTQRRARTVETEMTNGEAAAAASVGSAPQPRARARLGRGAWRGPRQPPPPRVRPGRSTASAAAPRRPRCGRRRVRGSLAVREDVDLLLPPGFPRLPALRAVGKTALHKARSSFRARHVL